MEVDRSPRQKRSSLRRSSWLGNRYQELITNEVLCQLRTRAIQKLIGLLVIEPSLIQWEEQVRNHQLFIETALASKRLPN